MKRISILIFVAALAFSAIASTVPTQNLRKVFHAAVLDAEKIPEFLSIVKGIKNPTPIEMAYQAAAEALKAQEEWNPVEKLLYLKKFNKMMQKAVDLDASEIEIRFLRFGIEYNIPGILGFSKNMPSDKQMIIDSVARIEKFEVDQNFTRYILTLLSDSGLCSEEEINLVRSKIQ
ncbi:MAG: hypothetical protein RJQ09_14610 [Cyclobacteriaceae bacterium]